MTLTKSEAKKLTKRVLAAATVKDVRVSVSSRRDGNTRYANNQPTTTGDVEELNLSVTAHVDGRSATVSGNRSDDASIRQLVKDAEELAKLAPRDPEAMPPLGPQKYPRVRARDGATAKMGAKERAEVAKQAIDVARGRQVQIAGLVRHAESSYATANRAGLFAYHNDTSVSLETTCRTPDGTGSGRSGFASHRVKGLDGKAVAERAAEKAILSRSPVGLDPGKYTVILEPEAVAALLGFLFRSLSARSADEGRSYFGKPGGGNRLGETLFDPRISIWSDPSDKDNPSSPIGSGGMPLGKTAWIDKGVVSALQTSRFWAQKTGKEPIPYGSSVHMAGGDGTSADLLRNVKRGVLVSRFWYNRMLEPRTILATGLTRDGTFLVEGGKVAQSIKNFRYNESPLTLLKNVVALGKPVRVGEAGRVNVVPPMVVEGFNFESVSDAV